MNLLDLIKTKPVVGLSPMDGVTDEPFRLLVTHTSSPDIVFTEFVSAEGLSHGGVKLYDHLLYSVNERPIIGQLFGKDPDSFYRSAVILSFLGFDGIDINMGCPAKTVTQHGSGAALINQPQLAQLIIKAVRQGIDDYTHHHVSLKDLNLNQKTLDVIQRNLEYSGWRNPDTESHSPTLSIKTRIGVDQEIVDQWIPFLLSQNPDFITLHGRTLRQGYAGLANWQAIQQAAKYGQKASIPVLGNGDVSSRSQALEYIKRYQVNGILIGRAALGNPWVFTDHCPSYQEKFAVAKKHYQLFTTIFPNRRPDCLRQHLLAYASGHPRAKELRSQLVSVSNFDELCHLEGDFLNC